MLVLVVVTIAGCWYLLGFFGFLPKLKKSLLLMLNVYRGLSRARPTSLISVIPPVHFVAQISLLEPLLFHYLVEVFASFLYVIYFFMSHQSRFLDGRQSLLGGHAFQVRERVSVFLPAISFIPALNCGKL